MALSPQGQPVSNVVAVQVSLSATAAQGQNVNSMLIVGSSAVIDVVSRMRVYSSLAAVAADFGTVAPEYLGATAWFSQSPQPLTLNIGRWAQTSTPAQIFGAPLSASAQAIANFTAVTTPGFYVVINGIPYSVAPASFAAQTNLNGVASLIQTALAALVPSTTCVWNATAAQFVITNGSTGVNSTFSTLSAPTAIGSATFSANPTASDTLVIAGTTVTFVASGAAGNQVNIGASLTATLASLLTLLSTSADVNLSKATYIVVGSVLYMTSKITGTAGNAYTLTKVSTAITVSGATFAGGSTTDISLLLGMNIASSGEYVAQGIAAESALTAVTILDNLFSNQWYGLAVLGAATADYIAIAGYVEGATVKHYQGCTSSDAATISAVDTTSLMYQLQQLKYAKTCCQYSSSSPYAAISYLARILTTNWNGQNTTITEFGKQEPGIAGESLSSTQRAAILSKNGVVYTNYNNATTILEGVTSCSGDFTDTIIAADWFALRLQTDVYNLLYTTPTKIPQTDQGMHLIASVLEADCAAAVNNGFLAPGTWTTTGFGAISLGTYLPKGYYIYQPSVASQSTSDRAARRAVAFQIAAKIAGAVHSANVSVTLNQ